ncbi:MAG: DinB family protein [Saprospiraceae bacterium]|nr:DinB family protein [Saprospiraceae bacterium]
MTQTALLDRLESEIRQLLEETRSQLAPLPAEALGSRPQPERWNALECFAHLNAHFDYFLPRIELAIHKSKARHWIPGEFRRQNWVGRMAIKAADPNNLGRTRKKSPKKIDPRRLQVRDHEVKAFLINCEMLLRLVQQARAVDLNRTTVKHFRWPGSRFMLGDLLEYMLMHAQRHFIQAREAAAKS